MIRSETGLKNCTSSNVSTHNSTATQPDFCSGLQISLLFYNLGKFSGVVESGGFFSTLLLVLHFLEVWTETSHFLVLVLCIKNH